MRLTFNYRNKFFDACSQVWHSINLTSLEFPVYASLDGLAPITMKVKIKKVKQKNREVCIMMVQTVLYFYSHQKQLTY